LGNRVGSNLAPRQCVYDRSPRRETVCDHEEPVEARQSRHPAQRRRYGADSSAHQYEFLHSESSQYIRYTHFAEDESRECPEQQTKESETESFR
jgi:hypothetical protein